MQFIPINRAWERVLEADYTLRVVDGAGVDRFAATSIAVLGPVHREIRITEQARRRLLIVRLIALPMLAVMVSS